MFIEKLNELRKDIAKWNHLAKKMQLNSTKTALMVDFEATLSKAILALSEERKQNNKVLSNDLLKRKKLRGTINQLKKDLELTLKEHHII